jgi:succinate dehydrogenase / fumarate reductase iron-sulfur subunit
MAQWAARLRTFRIRRGSPDDGANPRTDRYTLDLTGPMVLDARAAPAR